MKSLAFSKYPSPFYPMSMQKSFLYIFPFYSGISNGSNSLQSPYEVGSSHGMGGAFSPVVGSVAGTPIGVPTGFDQLAGMHPFLWNWPLFGAGGDIVSSLFAKYLGSRIRVYSL
jgi:hypothetical protein